MRIAIFPEPEVPTDLRVQVMRLQDAAWPPAQPSGVEPWHDPALDPISILVLEGDDRVLAALDVLSKDLAHAGEVYAASGISAMVTDPAHRGEGHGLAAVRAALDWMERTGRDLAIFTCDAPLQGYYERAGLVLLPRTVLIGGTPEAPFPSDRLGKVTVGSFLSERARASAEEFIGARVALFPGEIDRLW